MGTTTNTRDLCAVQGCNKAAHAKDVCGPHYSAIARGAMPHPRYSPPPPPRVAPTEWQVDAACRLVDPELFFPVSEKPTEPTVIAARRVCESCPVLQVCREWALTNMSAGIAGGLTTDERRQIRDDRKATAAQFETAGGAR